MRFADIDSIWLEDLSSLSNADKGRVYFERAKQVITSALADPKIFPLAVDGKRFRRDYLSKNIYCSESVLTQNPKIKLLLEQADFGIRKKVGDEITPPHSHSVPELDDVTQLRTIVIELIRRVNEQDTRIASLQAKLRVDSKE
ncbi:MAG: hypothetical protein CFE43_01950 [Burkholderiales bacterium PBB3]|nr:MAG: hypothetical protein CFE43_01950 [Burkholderiales bacterium PBB3]